MGASFFDDRVFDSQESEGEDENNMNGPGSKRRKLNSKLAVSSASNSDEGRRKTIKRKDSTLTGIAKVDRGVNRNIDFRTGTPSFMSTRVIKVGVGQPYEHHFTDDLESFFWLILWCAVEHVDDYNPTPTQVAQDILRQLNRQSLEDIGTGKRDILLQCFPAGKAIEVTLKACLNSWATDPAIISVVQKLGLFFFNIHTYETFLQCTPSGIFPKVVKIITDALEL